MIALPDPRTAAALAALAGDPDVRVLHRVRLPERGSRVASREAPWIGVAVDCETTGLKHDDDVVIEIAMRRFRYDDLGRIRALDRVHSWRQDPGRPLEPEIVRLTGLTNDDLAGRRIDAPRATTLLLSCDLVVAHNSSFDAPFFEAALPGARGMAWGCSVEGVAWRDLGFEGRSLGWLLAQCGWFYRSHRAGDDVDALVELLRHELPDGTTVLSHVMTDAARSGWLASAEGANFHRREELKRRGYRFDGSAKVWRREIGEHDIDVEREWLSREIYAPEHRPRASMAAFRRVDARNRYRLH